MAARLFRVILPVSDIAVAERFYSRVLGLPGKRVSAGRHYFDCGGTFLACFDAKADGDSIIPKANSEHVYFAVNDLEAAYDRAIAAECQWIEDKIQSRPWGETSFYARDPFGNPVCFVDEATMFKG